MNNPESRKAMNYFLSGHQGRDFQHEDIIYLQSLMLSISKQIGVKEPITDIENDLITKFIIRQFGDFTLKEIEYSFELAMAGKLDVNAEHYQSFNIKYIGHILKKYRSIRGKAIKEMDQIEMRKQEKQIDMTDFDYCKEMYNGLKKNTLNNKKVPEHWGWIPVWNYMSHEDLIDDVEDLKIFMEEQRQKLEQNIKFHRSNGHESKYEEAKHIFDNDDRFKIYWRSEWVKCYFRELLKTQDI